MGEITYPFPNINGGTVDVCEWMSSFIPHFTGHVIACPCMLEFKLNHVSKRGPKAVVHEPFDDNDGLAYLWLQQNFILPILHKMEDRLLRRMQLRIHVFNSMLVWFITSYDRDTRNRLMIRIICRRILITGHKWNESLVLAMCISCTM